ncbi:MAG: hypothetical protein IK997_02880 [Bacilli bacterium]|nr:hypothetical protein [Bacilli bacterium]
MFLSILIGYFEQFIFVFLLIFFHEIGHFETARLFKYKVDKIYLYPTGGISKFTSELNTSFIKELLVLINGPLMQIIIYFLIKTIYPYQRPLIYLKNIHYSILMFNLLPIYPLDGGKLLNLFLNKIFSFRKSFNYTIYLSYIVIGIFIILIPNHFKINYIFMVIFLIYKTTEEYKNRNYYFDKFILERYLYSYNFNKLCIVKSLNDFKKEYKHILNNNEKIYTEKEYLINKYEKQKD